MLSTYSPSEGLAVLDPLKMNRLSKKFSIMKGWKKDTRMPLDLAGALMVHRQTVSSL